MSKGNAVGTLFRPALLSLFPGAFTIYRQGEASMVASMKRVGPCVAPLLLLAVTGCMEPRVYPVCVLNAETPELARSFWGAAEPGLKSVVSSVVDEDTRFALTSGAMVVTAAPGLHARLEKIWPSFACITQTRNDARDDQNRRACQADVAKFFEKRWASWPGPVNLQGTRCSQVN